MRRNPLANGASTAMGTVASVLEQRASTKAAFQDGLGRVIAGEQRRSLFQRVISPMRDE